jgi:hypothetical protein
MKKAIIVLCVVILVVCVLVAGFILIFVSKDQKKIETNIAVNNVEEKIGQIQCSNSFLNVKIDIPGDWECVSGKVNGLLSVTSKIFTIQFFNSPATGGPPVENSTNILDDTYFETSLIKVTRSIYKPTDHWALEGWVKVNQDTPWLFFAARSRASGVKKDEAEIELEQFREVLQSAQKFN